MMTAIVIFMIIMITIMVIIIIIIIFIIIIIIIIIININSSSSVDQTTSKKSGIKDFQGFEINIFRLFSATGDIRARTVSRQVVKGQ